MKKSTKRKVALLPARRPQVAKAKPLRQDLLEEVVAASNVRHLVDQNEMLSERDTGEDLHAASVRAIARHFHSVRFDAHGYPILPATPLAVVNHHRFVSNVIALELDALQLLMEEVDSSFEGDIEDLLQVGFLYGDFVRGSPEGEVPS